MKQILLLLLFTISFRVLARPEPLSIFTDILVINDTALRELEDPFRESNKRFEVLKFLPHPKNSQYLSIWKCFIKPEEQAIGGKNCEAVSGGQYFEIKALKELEEIVEDQRKINSALKEVSIMVATIPLGVGIHGGVVRGMQLIRAGAMARRAVRWSAFGIGFAIEIGVGQLIDNATDEVVKLSPRYAAGKHISCTPGDSKCIQRESVIVVEDEVKLGESFKKLNNILSRDRKFIGPEIRMIKTKSNACINCFKTEIEFDHKSRAYLNLY